MGELEENMRRCYYKVFGSDIGISEQFIKQPKGVPDKDPTNVKWVYMSMDTLLKGKLGYSQYTKRANAWWKMKA